MSLPEPWAAGAVFAVSLGLLLLRPGRVPDWSIALAGGLVMVGVGVLPVQIAVTRLASSWNVLLFFLGLGLSAATADQAGVFRVVATLAVRLSHGSQHRLLVSLFVAGTLVTAVLSNDATALLLTPVAFAAATRLGVDPRPYAFTCALVANAASFLLPVSNPANLLVLASAPLALGAFLARLVIPSIVGLVATLVGLLWVFRAVLAEPIDLPAESGPVLDLRARSGLIGVCVLAVLYVAATALGWYLGPVAVAGAVVLLGLDAGGSGWQPRALASEVPWGIFPLLVGLLLLVMGGEQVGLFAGVVSAMSDLARWGTAGLPVAALGMAVVANLLNNLPAALVGASALSQLPSGAERSNLAAATVLGVNLGPNLTTAGSLATMLWLALLRNRGLEVSALEYVRVGAVITVPALLLASGALWLAAGMVGGG
jgi:arsenical pump membrane protein